MKEYQAATKFILKAWSLQITNEITLLPIVSEKQPSDQNSRQEETRLTPLKHRVPQTMFSWLFKTPSGP